MFGTLAIYLLVRSISGLAQGIGLECNGLGPMLVGAQKCFYIWGVYINTFFLRGVCIANAPKGP